MATRQSSTVLPGIRVDDGNGGAEEAYEELPPPSDVQLAHVALHEFNPSHVVVVELSITIVVSWAASLYSCQSSSLTALVLLLSLPSGSGCMARNAKWVIIFGAVLWLR